jgi:hypothetical protein
VQPVNREAQDLPHISVRDLVSQQRGEFLELAVDFGECGEANAVAVAAEGFGFGARFWK